MLVAFCGIDGSGKSSLIERVTKKGMAANCGSFRKRSKDHVLRLEESIGVTRPSYIDGDLAVVFCRAYVGDFVEYYRRDIACCAPSLVALLDRWKPCLMAWTSMLAVSHQTEIRADIDQLPDADLTFFLDTDPGVAHERLMRRPNLGRDENIAVLLQFRAAYLAYFQSYTGRFHILRQSELPLMAEEVVRHIGDLREAR